MFLRRYVPFLGLIAILLLSLGGTGAAQTLGNRTGLMGAQDAVRQNKPNEILGLGAVDIPVRVPEEAAFALDEAINPDTYILGPGDVMGVNLRSGSGWFIQSMITPDGELTVPRLPMIHLGGLTLSEAREKVNEQWGGGSRSDVDLSLLQMRRVRVSVGGSVAFPGEYIATPADRVTTLIEMAGGLLEGESSLRRVWLIRADGTRQRVDLPRYLGVGAKEGNPRLSGGDHLLVERRQLTGAMVDVGGAVASPGRFEWLEGDHLLDLIEVAGGLTPEAVRDAVEVVHFDVDGSTSSEIVDLDSLAASKERGPLIRSGDLVNVPVRDNRPRRATVTIQGEVAKPGVYSIVEGQTRLSEVIRRAGGFSELAYLPGGRVYLERPEGDFRDDEALRIDTLVSTDRDELDLEFLKYYFRSRSRDYLPVRMETVFKQDGTVDPDADVALYDGMVLNIPREPMLVLVAGQVMHPGYYPHVEGASFSHYIGAAGGYARGAHKRRARVVGYESPLWEHARRGTDVDAGAMIFVPNKAIGTDWENFRDVTAIILQIATLYLLFDRNNK